MAPKSAQEERKEQPQGSAPRVPPDGHLSTSEHLQLTERWGGGMAIWGCSASLTLVPLHGDFSSQRLKPWGRRDVQVVSVLWLHGHSVALL